MVLFSICFFFYNNYKGNIIPPPVISHGKRYLKYSKIYFLFYSMLVIFTSQEGTVPQGYSGFFASYQTGQFFN